MPKEPTRELALTNAGAAPLNWAALASTNWIRFSNSSGQLQPGETAHITADLDDQLVTTLHVGSHAARLDLKELSGTPPGVLSIPVTLTVTAEPLVVTPAEAFACEGYQGGPFAPLSKTYSLLNQGTSTLHWELTFDSEWLQSSGPMSGNLEPGASQAIAIQVDEAPLAGFAVGQHNSYARIHDLDAGIEAAQRAVRVSVIPDAGGAGWTSFTPSSDSRLVYVSNSLGNDSNQGLSPSTPKRTIESAANLLRHGQPDWLLLRKGDTWTESLGNWLKSGRSPTEPLLISSYGSGSMRPVLCTSLKDGIGTYGGSGVPPVIENVAIVGLHFLASDYNGSNGPVTGVGLYHNAKNWLIEDCEIEGYTDNVVIIGGPHKDIALRRCIIVDNYTANTGIKHSQGLYAQGIDGLLIEECIFDNCNLIDPSIFDHAMYIDWNDTTNVVIQRNIVSRASSHGILLRPGGVAQGNLISRAGIGIELGSEFSNQLPGGGAAGSLEDNVILEGANTGGSPRGWGILLTNVIDAHVEDNVIANNTVGSYPRPLLVGGLLHNATLRKNIVHSWGGEGLYAPGASGITLDNLTLDGNDFQNQVSSNPLLDSTDPALIGEITSMNNRFFSSMLEPKDWIKLGPQTHSVDEYKSMVGDTSSASIQVAYPDPDRTLGAYHGSLGKPATYEDFILEARKQSRDYWRSEYTAPQINAWVQAGFGKTP